jgi:predicted DsbA family dithiol-disulfide isomerase
MGAERRRVVWQNIHVLAEEIQLPMKQPSILVNSRLALEAAEFAAEAGFGEAFEERVFRSYFQEDANIGDPNVIGALAAEVGIDRAAMEHALSSGRYGLKLKNTTMMAHNRDVTGVPTFFIGQLPLVGAQSPDVMRKLIARAIERNAPN